MLEIRRKLVLMIIYWDFKDYKFIIYPIGHFMVRVAETSAVNI
jgi:hypothetical protein